MSEKVGFFFLFQLHPAQSLPSPRFDNPKLSTPCCSLPVFRLLSSVELHCKPENIYPRARIEIDETHFTRAHTLLSEDPQLSDAVEAERSCLTMPHGFSFPPIESLAYCKSQACFFHGPSFSYPPTGRVLEERGSSARVGGESARTKTRWFANSSKSLSRSLSKSVYSSLAMTSLSKMREWHCCPNQRPLTDSKLNNVEAKRTSFRFDCDRFVARKGLSLRATRNGSIELA